MSHHNLLYVASAVSNILIVFEDQFVMADLDVGVIEQDYLVVELEDRPVGAVPVFVEKVIVEDRYFCLECDLASFQDCRLAGEVGAPILDSPHIVDDCQAGQHDLALADLHTDGQDQETYCLEAVVHSLDIAFLASNCLVANTEIVVGADMGKTSLVVDHWDLPFCNRHAYVAVVVVLVAEEVWDNFVVAAVEVAHYLVAFRAT